VKKASRMGSKAPKKKVQANKNPWSMFTGKDLCYPVEMFAHIMEFKSGQEGSDDAKMATDVLSHIPDPKTGAKKGAPPPEGPPPAHLNVPSAIWKHKATEGGTKQDLKWSELKPGLLEEFGSTKAEYSLKEKLELLQSVGKGAYEDSQAYLIRIRCVVSLLTQNKVPATLEELPLESDLWVRLIFLFGLDEIEQNLVIEESDAKTLDELCKVLALPEVKMIRRADDAMAKDAAAAAAAMPPATAETEMVPTTKATGTRASGRKRKRKNYAAMLDDFSDDDDRGAVKEELGTLNTDVNIKVEQGLDEMDVFGDDDFKPVDMLGGDHDMEPDATFVPDDDEHDNDDDDDFVDKDGNVLIDEDGEFKPKRLKAAEKKGVTPKKESQPGVKRSWPCVFCEVEPYKKRAELWAHQDEVHEGFREGCKECDLKFKKPAELHTHNKEFHPELAAAAVAEAELVIGEGKKAKTKKYKKYVYDQVSAQIEEAQKEETDGAITIRKTRIVVGESGKQEYICGICNQHLSDRKKMEQHTKIVHKGNKVECALCGTQYNRAIRLAQHHWVHHQLETSGYPTLKCPHCDYRHCFKGHLDKHILAQHMRTHQCQTCLKFYPTLESLSLHIERVHQRIRPEKCDFCGNGFNNIHELNKHKAIVHTNEEGLERDIKCDTCGKTFVLPYQLIRHNRYAHGEDKKKRICDRCPPGKSKLYSEKRLMIHIEAAHKDVQPEVHACYVCGKTFKSQGAVTRHIDCFHLKIRKFKCDICEHGFNSKYDLQRHKAVIHKDVEGKEPDIMCPTCGKMFMFQLQLSRHIKFTHEAKKDLICEQCPPGKSEKYTRVRLLKHIQIAHIQNHVCCVCKKSYPHQCALRKHYRSLHMKYKQFFCKLCNMSWTSMTTAKEHFGVKHLNSHKNTPSELIRKHPGFYDTKDDKNSDYPSDEFVDKLMEEEELKIKSQLNNL